METGNWSSDCSNSDDEDHPNTAIPWRGGVKGQCTVVDRVVQYFIGKRTLMSLADYCAVGNSEVNMRRGTLSNYLKLAVQDGGNSVEGWAPAAYLENLHRKSSRSSSRSQDRLND
ncbi:hypothetical protein NQ318_017768 [Aromia moschata]|uniref:Uncharacterized protein n=1 Tax=Aromia moschata TaxID=1265417 RepID=A0AAV8XW29_9CUCU|nr:hypothetical protein NQ318_017768 [Aromia moschata]